MFGVVLNIWIALADVHTPSWAVALGTPVLVFAALHWILQAIWTRTWMDFTGKLTEGKDLPHDYDEEEGSVEEEGKELENEEKKDTEWWNSRAYVSQLIWKLFKH